LATVTPSSTASFRPVAAGDWRRLTIDLKPFIGTTNLSNVIIGFEGVNRYGNNLFLDNVNVTKRIVVTRDISPQAVIEPGGYVCTPTTRPVVRVANVGRDTITSFRVTYVVNNAATGQLVAGDVVNWTGTLLRSAPNNTVNVNLNTVSGSLFVPGTYLLTAITSIPNNLVDQNITNDTVRALFTVLQQVPVTTTLPLKEGFDVGAFPPALWEIRQTPVDAITWSRTNAASKTGPSSMYINNYNYNAFGRRDMMVSPLINYTGADSVKLNFDLSAVTYSYPGSTAIPLDTLEVMITTDCNRSFQTVWKKYGPDLQTILDPNFPVQDEFFPEYDFQWRNEQIDLTQLLGGANNFQFAFRNTVNFENNIFIDNVNFAPKAVNARLKSKGFMVSPNPTYDGNLYIQHYPRNPDLRSIALVSSIGQTLKTWRFPSGGDNTINIQVNGYPAGVYNLVLTYTNKVVVERVLIARQ
jgi:hypothetical protein